MWKDLKILNKSMKITLSGMFAAFIFLATYFFKFFPAGGGYLNMGDGIILMTAVSIGPFAIPAAAIGSLLSDLLLGYALYAPATFIIKGMMALIVWLILKCGKRLVPSAVLGFLLAELVMVGGYFLFEWFAFGFQAAFANLTFNFMQAAFGIIIGILFLPVSRAVSSKLSHNYLQKKITKKL